MANRSSSIAGPSNTHLLDGADELITDPRLSNFWKAASAVDYNDFQTILELISSLDELSVLFAKDQQLRHRIGTVANPSFWVFIHELWLVAANAHVSTSPVVKHQSMLCLSLARFTRNLVAAEPLNQAMVFENEPAVRILMHHYTSFMATKDPTTFAVTRMLVQTLSNLVTANETLTRSLWASYLQFPEEQLILLRLLASPDPRTVSSTFVFVLNCIHESTECMELLISSARGPRLCIAMLDRMVSLSDAEDSSENGHAFDIGFEIFVHVIEQGLVPDLYTKLAVADEVIASHQITLLKLLDSYLQPSLRARNAAMLNQQSRRDELVRMLIITFLVLSTYTKHAVQRAIGTNVSADNYVSTDVPKSTDGRVSDTDNIHTKIPHPDVNITPPRKIDLLLPQVCQALVLVTQCFISMALGTEEANLIATIGPEPIDTVKGRLREATTSNGQGLVETLIETLGLLDIFLPRITFGKVVQRPDPPGQNAQAQGLDQACIAASRNTGTDNGKLSSSAGFSYVKRDLVRLLGILCADDRAVQDRVRMCGGIPVVMNLCVVDDQNPYLREHAIFTLRNLLHGNTENQAVVQAIQPVGRWDANGLLRSL